MIKKRSTKARTNSFQPKSETIGRDWKEVWQRYEISYSKKYALKIIDEFLQGDKNRQDF